MAKTEKIRAFIAVPLPQPILRELAALQRRLQEEIPSKSVRWVRPEGIHLTLKFLGDTPTDKLPAVEQGLAAVAHHAPGSFLTVEGLGCFPRPSCPRVIWVGVEEPTGKLTALQAAIEEAMGHLGFKPERRKFHPHLTLGRVNRRTSRQDAKRIGDILTEAIPSRLGEMSADRFALIRSVLKPTGAEYTTLKEFPLVKE